jgi:hypothetical protein
MWYISLLAFDYLASVPPPSPGAGRTSDTMLWSRHTVSPSEPETQTGTVPSPSGDTAPRRAHETKCWREHASGTGRKHCRYCIVESHWSSVSSRASLPNCAVVHCSLISHPSSVISRCRRHGRSGQSSDPSLRQSVPPRCADQIGRASQVNAACTGRGRVVRSDFPI